MIPFQDIPTNFILNTLTVHQKEIIQIKDYIKLALDNWTKRRGILYEQLAPELHLGSDSIRRFAEKLPKEVPSEDLVCPCCKTDFKLEYQAYWSYIDSDSTIKLLEPEGFLILCSRKCSTNMPEDVKAMSERKFYYVQK